MDIPSWGRCKSCSNVHNLINTLRKYTKIKKKQSFFCALYKKFAYSSHKGVEKNKIFAIVTLMKLSLRIPLATAGILFSTLFVNIGGLWLSLSEHVPHYVNSFEVSTEVTTVALTPEKLRSLFFDESMNDTLRSEYQNTLIELSKISDSLRSVSENPELYIDTDNSIPANPNSFRLHTGSGQVTVTISDKPTTIEQFFNIFRHPSGVDPNSPEGALLFGVIRDFFIINAVWFLVVLLVYILWIRRVFSPIHIINERLKTFLHIPASKSIRYTKSDEFQPLIQTVNTLHSSLEAQEAIRSQFLADLSHEIRTPMTSIQCIMEAINDGIMEMDTKTTIQIQNEIARLVTITNRIMEYGAFVNSLDTDEEKHCLPIKEQTADIIAQYEPQLLKSSQKIISRIPHKLEICMSQNQYIQILHNIFSNFIKYAGENTTLTCKYKKTSQAHQLIFSDNGRGISKEHLPMITEKFYREDPGRTP